MKCDGCGKTVPHVRYRTKGPWAGAFLCRECWIAPTLTDVRFGLEAEWKDFEPRHQRFFARWPELERIMNAVVSRQLETDSVADKVIFFLGRLGVEDFAEIFLNAGNGYGVAGLKLLRSLFERVVTMMHLIRNPGDVQDFLDYHQVHLGKTMNHIKAAGGDPAKYFSAEELVEIEKNYQAAKAKFGNAMSWTTTDLATMATNVGLRPAYLALFYFPTLQLHTTVLGLATRTEVTDTGVVFKPGAQRKLADVAFDGAHLCLSLILEEHIRHFNLDVDPERVRAIYQDCWPGEVGEPKVLRQEEAES